MQIWDAIARQITNTDNLIVNIIVGLITAGLAFLFRPVRQYFTSLARSASTAFRAQKIIDHAKKRSSGSGIWLDAPKYPDNYEIKLRGSKPIITIAQLKGGVGKTTIAGNLAAYYAIEKGQSVLLIDLDFQGSLSSMVGAPRERIPSPNMLSKSAYLIAGDMTAGQLINAAIPVPDAAGLRALTTHYDIAIIENREMVHWLLETRDRDVRYILAQVLHDRLIQDAFDRIIIDAPPRMTTATIQALCASTHVLIPTVLDRLSGESVGTFVDEIEKLKLNKICPELKTIGVVGSMTNYNTFTTQEGSPTGEASFLVSERQGLAEIRSTLSRLQKTYGLPRPPAELLPVDTYIQRLAAISAHAGESLVYPRGPEAVRAMFQRLGREVDLRI